MRGKQALTYEAAGKVMTLAELEDVLTAARDAGATGDAVPKIRIAFGGAVQSVRVEIPAMQDVPQGEA